MSEFCCHLHNHSAFSLKDSTSRPEEIMERCKKLGYKSYALTDHGNMSGIIPFYKAAQDSNIKPILGVEAYFCEDATEKIRKYYHLLILAKNLKGYQDLMKAVSYSHTDGFYYKPRMDWSILEQLSNVVVTTACIGGVLLKDFNNTDHDDITTGPNMTQRLQKIFKDDLYVELQMHDTNYGMFKSANDFAMETAKKLGIKTVLTNDIHYTNPEDSIVHKMWLAAGKNTAASVLDYVYDDSFYIKDQKEMAEIAPNDECMETTREIEDKIDWIDLNIGISHMPTVDNMTVQDCNERMKEIVKEKLALIKNDREEYKERLKTELSFLIKNNLTPYFFPIYDAFKYSDECGIHRGPGRGSAGGSLVANFMNITDVDPLEYGLRFDRFLNAGRVHKQRVWEVETEDGAITHIAENFTYHIKQKDGTYQLVKGIDLVKEFDPSLV